MVDRPFQPLFWSLAQLGSRIRPRRRPVSPPGSSGSRHPRRSAFPLGTARCGSSCNGPSSERQCPGRDAHARRRVREPLPGAGPPHRPAPGRRVGRDGRSARLRHGASGAVPVAEEQMLDVARWVQTGAGQDWDGAALALSGVSAGAKLAIDVCQQLHAAGLPGPQAIALVVPVIDVTRTDRTSSIRRPAISPLVQRFVGWAYFPDVARRREPPASPLFDDTLAGVLPPTLILTGADDTLAPEGAALAAALRAAGTSVEHTRVPRRRSRLHRRTRPTRHQRRARPDGHVLRNVGHEEHASVDHRSAGRVNGIPTPSILRREPRRSTLRASTLTECHPPFEPILRREIMWCCRSSCGSDSSDGLPTYQRSRSTCHRFRGFQRRRSHPKIRFLRWPTGRQMSG